MSMTSKNLMNRLLKNLICLSRFIIKTNMELPKLLKWKNVGIGVVCVAVGSEVVKFAYNWISDQYKNGNETINEVLFFPDDSVRTYKDLDRLSTHDYYNLHKVTSGDDQYKNSPLLKMLGRLKSTERRLDLCLYLITCHEFSKAILYCLEKGVVVRLILEQSSEGISGCQVGKLREAGVFVRARKKQYLMHHKFALVDGKVLVNGSFNWSGQAVMANNENVVITNQENIVGKFVEEFERLWIQFDPDSPVI